MIFGGLLGFINIITFDKGNLSLMALCMVIFSILGSIIIRSSRIQSMKRVNNISLSDMLSWARDPTNSLVNRIYSLIALTFMSIVMIISGLLVVAVFKTNFFGN